MQIIIEYVLLDNFLIDVLLLFVVNKIIKLPINKLGLVVAGMFGAGFALVSPVILVSGFGAICIKIAVAGVMVFMSNFSLYKFFIKLLLFILFTFAFGGMLIAAFSFMGVSVYDSMYIGYVSTLPLGAIFVSGFVFLWFSIKAIKSIFVSRKFADTTCEIIITANQKDAKLVGFVDSGNALHNSAGKSIIVINEDTLRNWFSPFERTQIMLGKDSFLPNCESLSVSSLGGEYKIRVFDCVALVQGVKKQSALGIAPSKIRYGKCNAIISNELLEV